MSGKRGYVLYTVILLVLIGCGTEDPTAPDTPKTNDEGTELVPTDSTKIASDVLRNDGIDEHGITPWIERPTDGRSILGDYYLPIDTSVDGATYGPPIQQFPAIEVTITAVFIGSYSPSPGDPQITSSSSHGRDTSLKTIVWNWHPSDAHFLPRIKHAGRHFEGINDSFSGTTAWDYRVHGSYSPRGDNLDSAVLSWDHYGGHSTSRFSFSGSVSISNLPVLQQNSSEVVFEKHGASIAQHIKQASKHESYSSRSTNQFFLSATPDSYITVRFYK